MLKKTKPEKIRNYIMVNICSPLIGAILRVISWIVSIARFLTSISVDTLWLLIMVIIQFNLIIVFFGILVILPQETTYQTIRSKLRSGTSRIRAGLQRIRTKCSTKQRTNSVNYLAMNIEVARMNYYFTGILIILITLLALCGGPSAY